MVLHIRPLFYPRRSQGKAFAVLRHKSTSIDSGGSSDVLKRCMSSSDTGKAQADNGKDWYYPISASDRISEKKSIFLAHATKLPDLKSFPTFLNHLKSLPALKRATHCMYAYRTVDPATLQPILGQHDGGESGSGDRLARLLELSGCENMVVVVSRWYGGVKLGSDRWRLISTVANQAIDMGGFKKARPQENDKGTGKKKRR
ncbi:hypothetical protein D9611_000010 [Ephemerocybe angulata]|uniref:Impact N-terminal domain-containing protein n=1 Tax=Ephemerocybe angulata TaxID=980116 RepID=A0A8H5BPD1_9AGAR|nr:hypothetical protein D9611_000010 [Tulosesus angulatus]